jgi:lysyl-tRNA synthetase class 2
MKIKNWWHPDHFARKIPFLEKRAKIIKSIRTYFDDLGYTEVETPALQHSAVMDPHIKAFETEFISPNQSETRRLFLHTSPEFAMKKMLVGGMKKIYQICKTFRNAEDSPNHSPEFTMIEWYHTGLSYEDLMQECVGLMRAVTDVPYKFRGMESDAHQPWEIISVCEAFQKYAHINLESVLNDLDGFKKLAGDLYHEGDEWDDIFFRVFLEKIEPNLGHPVPTIIYDYPIHMASLSRPKQSDPRFCERFEIYICGLELANAFGELCDAGEQKRRFAKNMAEKKRLYGDDYPIDHELIEALSHGMDDVSGIALGVDRLVMLATGADHINDIISEPVYKTDNP